MGSTLLIDGCNVLPVLELVRVLDMLSVVAAEAGGVSQLLGNVWLGVQVALGLGFVIFVHELGHFLAAKTFGVRCDKFYVGFDVPISVGPIKLPRTLGKFQWGETEYGIGIIPLGGYVKMLGQDDDPRQAENESQKIRLGEGEEAPLDPRSYPAKPVWQRMIIISAGVVMNLIFAVILAGVAYWFGVPYTPTVAGSTFAGSPAWAAGIETGDQIVKYGKQKDDDPNLRYGDFAMAVVMQGFDGREKQLPLTVERGGSRTEITAVPTGKYSPDGDIYRIGFNEPTTPKIASPAFSPLSFLADKKPDLQPGDLITAVNAETLPTDPRFEAVLGSELTARLQANWEKPVTVSIDRMAKGSGESPQQVTVELPAVPVKTLGLGFAPGPVTAIRSGSAAEAAGIQVGDQLAAIDGQPIVDGLHLPAQVAKLAGQEFVLTVKRPVVGSTADENTETLDFKLLGPEQPKFDPVSGVAGELTLGGLGVAFGIKPSITSVDPEATYGSGGFQVGDELRQIQWVATAERKAELKDIFKPQAYEIQAIDDTLTIASFYDLLQNVPAGAEIKCWVRRDGKTVDTMATLYYAKDWYWHQRGIGLSPLMHTQRTDSLATALKLGVWETSRRFGDVLGFLRLLVTGKIGAKGVGGPIEIARAASSEASFGVSRLMLFLTLLSANLAIINFLPIPALDGGHMLFLTAEAIRGKPVPEALQIRLTMVGVLSLLSLMAFVIVKDIMRLMS